QIRSDSPAQEETARGEAKGARVGADEPKVLELRHGILIEDLRQLTEDQRLIETQAQHHTLAPSDLDRKRLNLTVRSRSGPERLDVRGQPRRVPPAPSLDRRHRANAKAEIVAPQPVREIVLRAQLAISRPAEVGGLVPA